MKPASTGITLRSVGAVLLGYIVLVGIILGSFTTLTKTQPLDTVFEPGTFVPTEFMIGFSLAVSILAALLAGLLCANLAGSRRPTYVFAGIVAALGLVSIMFTLSAARPAAIPRVGDESAEAIMVQATARKPAWLSVLEPLLGVSGILLGGRLRRRKPV